MRTPNNPALRASSVSTRSSRGKQVALLALQASMRTSRSLPRVCPVRPGSTRTQLAMRIARTALLGGIRLQRKRRAAIYAKLVCFSPKPKVSRTAPSAFVERTHRTSERLCARTVKQASFQTNRGRPGAWIAVPATTSIAVVRRPVMNAREASTRALRVKPNATTALLARIQTQTFSRSANRVTLARSSQLAVKFLAANALKGSMRDKMPPPLVHLARMASTRSRRA